MGDICCQPLFVDANVLDPGTRIAIIMLYIYLQYYGQCIITVHGKSSETPLSTQYPAFGARLHYFNKIHFSKLLMFTYDREYRSPRVQQLD